MIKVDVLGDDSDCVLGEQRVAPPETRACDVTNVESRFGHVIDTILRRRVINTYNRFNGNYPSYYTG